MSPAKRTFDAERLELIGSLERSHFWFVARRALVLHLVQRYRRLKPAIIADVGCGTGLFAARLAEEDRRVLALDLSPEGLRRLREARLPVWTAQSTATALPVPACTVDLVLALDVFEHTDDTKAISEAARIVKPDGILVITVPAMPSLWSARDEEAGHLRRYTRQTLAALVTAAGLELVHMRFYQCLLLPLTLLTRLAGRRWRSTQRVEERPGAVLNALLLAVSRFEVAAGDYVRWPCGSSLAVVARKPVRRHDTAGVDAGPCTMYRGPARADGEQVAQ